MTDDKKNSVIMAIKDTVYMLSFCRLTVADKKQMTKRLKEALETITKN